MSTGINASPETRESECGSDVKSHDSASTYVNWLSENSRSRRVQTNATSSNSIATETEVLRQTAESGTDPIPFPKPNKHACLSNLALDLTNVTPEGSVNDICSIESDDRTAEPRNLDECSVDGDNEIIYLFRSKTGDSIEDGSDSGKGELRTLRCKETCDVACGPDVDLQEQTVAILQEQLTYQICVIGTTLGGAACLIGEKIGPRGPKRRR